MQSSTDLQGTKHASDPETQHPSRQSHVISEAVLKSPVYDDNCTSRGRAIIVENFPARDRGKSHLVTQCKELGDILESIETQGFDLHEDIQLYQNLSAEALYSLCSKVAETDFSDCYCLLVIILARGRPGLIRCYDEKGSISYAEQSKILEIFQPQNCPSLALKPKLFVIQTIPDDPDPNEADSKGMPDDQEPVKYMFKIPREADFLTYTSNQHVFLEENGFLSSIITNFRDMKKNWNDQRNKTEKDVPDIHSFLIQINRSCKTKYSMKTIPCTTSSLTKRMYLQRRIV